MARKAPKVSSVAVSAGEDIHGRFSGLWGFVDERIKRSLIETTVMSWVRLQCDSFFEGKSAGDLMEKIDTWKTETARYIAVKHLMYVDDVSECEIPCAATTN
jgi:hypothetical protein